MEFLFDECAAECQRRGRESAGGYCCVLGVVGKGGGGWRQWIGKAA